MRISILLLSILFSTSLYSQLYISIVDTPENTPENSNIYLAGNVNQWNPASKDFKFKKDSIGNFYLILDSLELEELVQFKFTLGTWSLVETELNGAEISNREHVFIGADSLYLSIDAWKDPSITNITKSSAAYNVEIINDSFYMPSLDRYRRIWIYLPPDYDIDDNEYPVLYMQDGQNLFDNATSYSGEWRVDESLNELFEEGADVPIVIGIDHGSNYRLNEYCVEDYKEDEHIIIAEGKEYLLFLTTTLKPYVDSHYRTKPEKEFTGIMGSSLGGLISTYAILYHSDIFGLAGLYSSSYWLSDSIYSIPFTYDPPFRIYSEYGSEEEGSTLENIKRMNSVFTSKIEVPNSIKLEVIEGGKHDERTWSNAFKSSILFLYN